ncbi:MAG TPA: hypothetical protein VFQ59_01500 [Candidatus Paceibacterota bacterium]|nr:hypothetical protein [Candidatus Paceibacterota bacterium]
MDTDTPLLARAYNLGLKAVPNFVILTKKQIEYYEGNLDELKNAISRGFIIPKPDFNFSINVDRSVNAKFPVWVEEIINPELQNSGPENYDLSSLELWLHDDQKNGVVGGNTIYESFKVNNLLEGCLNLQDGLAIRAKGIMVFRELFQGKAVYLWKSVVQNRDGDLYVPYLYVSGDEVWLIWSSLDYNWNSNYPALRFSK